MERSPNDPSPRATRTFSPSAISWLASTLALIGLAAVYFTATPPDNAVTRIGAETADAAVAPAAEAARTGLTAFVKKAAPAELPAVTFTDGEGGAKSLADFKGKTVLLNVWATWCAPCREEMPGLDRLQSELGSDKFEVVALSVDRGGVKASKKFLDQINVKSLGTYVDASGKSTKALKIIGMPTTLLLDDQGREVGRLVGPAHWDSDEAKKLIEAHLR
ncbi:MAG: TlpA family protein disulfide reductase [Alphaproteobacteria bacterium]|nr:TlpA family protein disulfide reductase [Alphaproteobacteria bacterium]